MFAAKYFSQLLTCSWRLSPDIITRSKPYLLSLLPPGIINLNRAQWQRHISPWDKIDSRAKREHYQMLSMRFDKQVGTKVSFCNSCRSFKAFFWISREKRKQKSNAIVMKFYVIIFTDTNHEVGNKICKILLQPYWFLLSLLVRYSKESFKRPAAVTKTGYRCLAVS